MALQGTVNESLMRTLLRRAGAEILDPSGDGIEFSTSEFESLHPDGALRWPEEGIDDWVFVEFKFLRANACIDIMLNGIESDRMYTYQMASYLLGSREACDTMGWQIPPPKRILFFLVPKDPSTTRMLLLGRVRPGKKDTPEKRAWKESIVERVQQDGVEFYTEILSNEDAPIALAQQEIRRLPEQLRRDEPPDRLHDSSLDDDKLNVECRFYCGHLEQCRQRGD